MSSNKIAVITGGSRGLGKNMALALARKNIASVITYAGNEEGARETVREVKALGVNCSALQVDLSDTANIASFVAALKKTLKEEHGSGEFNFLVNNAGIGATVPFEKVTEELYDKFHNVHLKSVYFLTQQCLPLMADGGRIINISSGTTRFANPGYSVYASMKGAVEVFTRYLAKELGPRKITANVVAPGPIETDFNNAAIRSNPQLKGMLSQNTPLGRVGVADDIGPVVAFLCSEDAGWINGQRIEVSGGINS